MNPIESIVRKLDAIQQRHRLPAIVVGVVKKYGDDRAGALAALLTYYGFLSLFPLLLLLTTVLGYTLGAKGSGLHDAIVNSALKDFPIIGTQLRSAINPLHGSGVGLVVGLLGLLWGALGITQVGQMAMADVWDVPGVERPNFVSRLRRGLVLFAVLGLGLVVSTFAASISTFGGAPAFSRVLGPIVAVGLNLGLYILGFRILTVPEVNTRELVPGAILGGIGWSLLQLLGGYLVGHQLRHASQLYGYFGSVLGLIYWLYLGAQLSLLAAEFNVVRARRLWPRSIVQPPLTEADRRVLDHVAAEAHRRPEQSVVSTWRSQATEKE